MPKIYTKEELATLLNVSVRTLDRWHAQRIGPARIKLASFIGYREEAVSEWFKSNETLPV